MRDLRPASPGSLRLDSIIESGPSCDLCSICKSDHPFSTHCYIGNSDLCQTLAENANSFLKFQSQKNPSEVPQAGDGIEAPRHICRWHAAQRLWRGKALQPRRRCWPPPGTAAFRLRQFPRPRQPNCQQPGTTEVVGMLSSIPVQPTNEQ